jgi:hypothetical protein
MKTLTLTYNNKPLNLFFGAEFINVFIYELDREFEEVDYFTFGGIPTGEFDQEGNPVIKKYSLKEYLPLSRDIIKACAIAYIHLFPPNTEEISTEKPLVAFSDLEFQSMYLSPAFRNKFLEVFEQTLKAFTPQPDDKEQVKKGSKKK